MALGDTLLNQLRKNAEKNGELQPTSSKIKSKAALIISIFAAIYSVNAFFQGQLNSKILNTTIEINDTWSFYQAKSIKQTQYEIAADEVEGKNQQKFIQYRATVERYETEPNEGKQALLAKAHKLEHERDIAKKKSPWIGIAGSIMQIAIVLLTASILSAGAALFFGGLVAMTGALALMAQGIFLIF